MNCFRKSKRIIFHFKRTIIISHLRTDQMANHSTVRGIFKAKTENNISCFDSTLHL